MWLFTTVGFFSAVQKSGTDDLTIRARVRDDLDHLRAKYLPALGPTKVGGGTDYPYRATVSHDAFARACGKMVKDVRYANFKNAVEAQQGEERAKVYHEVWSAVSALEPLKIPGLSARAKRKSLKEAADPASGSGSGVPAKQPSYGGAVFDDQATM